MTSFSNFQLRGAGLIGLGYAAFVMLMLDGFALGQRGAGQMAIVILGLFLLFAVAFALLWARQMHQDGKRRLADEREELIEAAAERAGYRILDAAIFVLMLVALTDAQWGWLGSFALTRPEGVVFALVTASAAAGLARFVAGYVAARRL